MSPVPVSPLDLFAPESPTDIVPESPPPGGLIRRATRTFARLFPTVREDDVFPNQDVIPESPIPTPPAQPSPPATPQPSPPRSPPSPPGTPPTVTGRNFFTSLDQVSAYWENGGTFYEADHMDIFRLFGPRQAVTMDLVVPMTVPLVGPFSNFDSFMKLLINRFIDETIEFIDISGFITFIFPRDVGSIDFFEVSFGHRTSTRTIDPEL